MFPLLLLIASALATTSYTTTGHTDSSVPANPTFLHEDTNLGHQVFLIVIQKLYFIISLF